MKTATHPGRSFEFLSRLHDGDLSPGERARFEAHRAHCAECRRAAAEFESALSLYRSTSTSPAAPDLAGRILRRLQTASPRRRPFGIFYGIDVRWAGAFAAALLAMIIGSAVVLRQQAPRSTTASTTPIPVQLEKGRVETQPSNAEQPLARNRSLADPAPGRADDDDDAASEARTNADELKSVVEPSDAKREVRIAAAAPAAPAPPPASVPAKERDAAPRPASEQEAFAGRIASRDEPSGGERSAAAASDVAAAESNVLLRLEITALDGEGTPPRTLHQPELAPEHRGRTFILIVSASGQVLEVLPQEEEAERGAQEESAKRQKLARREVPEGLSGLRFETGNRPRRLLLTVR